MCAWIYSDPITAQHKLGSRDDGEHGVGKLLETILRAELGADNVLVAVTHWADERPMAAGNARLVVICDQARQVIRAQPWYRAEHGTGGVAASGATFGTGGGSGEFGSDGFEGDDGAAEEVHEDFCNSMSFVQFCNVCERLQQIARQGREAGAGSGARRMGKNERRMLLLWPPAVRRRVLAGESAFPYARLLVPHIDSERGRYGMKSASVAQAYKVVRRCCSAAGALARVGRELLARDWCSTSSAL
jgi:hypothetical protein